MLKFVFIFALSSCLCEYYVSTYAGSRGAYADGPSQSASFHFPYGVVTDQFGNLFVADSTNHMIRKINSTGYVSTVAGNGTAAFSDGQSKEALFNLPTDVAVDLFGNIFVSDTNNNMIRMINVSGYVTTLDITPACNYPAGLTIDKFGNIIVVDSGNSIIRRIDSTGHVITIAGHYIFAFSDGQGVDASFYLPDGVAADSVGNLFVCDTVNNRIRKINTTGYVSTFAGNGSHSFSDGQGTEAALFGPSGITIDSFGNLFVTDTGNQRIRKIDSFGYVTTIAGTGYLGFLNGIGSIAAFDQALGITIDSNGTIFVADSGNNKIRKIYFPKSTLFSTRMNPVITTFGSSINPTPVETDIPSTVSIVLSPSISLQYMSTSKNISVMYLKPGNNDL